MHQEKSGLILQLQKLSLLLNLFSQRHRPYKREKSKPVRRAGRLRNKSSPGIRSTSEDRTKVLSRLT